MPAPICSSGSTGVPGTTATGTGLGLAIARELAQRMDGTLSVESAEGSTKFVLSLPSGSEPSLR